MSSTHCLFIFIQLVLLCAGGSRLMAQQPPEKGKFYFSLNFGGRFINRDSLANAGDLDFMNYLCKQKKGAEYGMLSFNLRMAASNKLEFSVTTVLLSNLKPDQLNLDVRYKPGNKDQPLTWGLTGSFFIYPQYLENYNSYHILRDSGFIADLNPNFRQISIYDLGFAAGPTMNYQYRRFHAEISFGAGVSGFVNFKETISQKKTDANLKREFRYETRYSPAVFLMPDAEIGFRLNSAGRVNIGIILKTGGMWSKRAINYTRTTYTWTHENATINNVKPEKQWYRKNEILGGFYMAF